MKKVALVVLSSVAALYATSITVPTGWSLLGAINGISPSQIACANTVWTYNNGGGNWNLYVKTPVSGNYGFNTISSIDMGQGFWVNNTSGSACTLDFSATAPTTPTYYSAYGLTFVDRKTEPSTFAPLYNRVGNTISYNSANTTFTLDANLSDNNDSRTGLKMSSLSDTNKLSQIEAKIKLVEGTTKYNRAQVVGGKITMSHDSSVTGYAVLSLHKNGAYASFNTQDSNGTTIESLLPTGTLSTTNMVGKTVDAKIALNGSTVVYTITGDVNATYSFTPSAATLTSGIGFAEIRSRNDDATALSESSQAGSLTKVELSAVGVLPYGASVDINTTSATTLSFADLSSFIMFDGQGKEYTKVTKSASTFSATDYDYDGTTWSPNSGPSGTVSGNRITFSTTGAVYEFAILGTQKVNSAFGINFTDLYISQATTTCITAPSSFEYDVWSWDNPTYYNSSTQQQVSITNLSTLLAGFTAPDQGMRFGNDSSTMFLNAGGTVVAGAWDGVSYYQQCTDDCRIFTRTTNVVGSWTSDASKIYVEVPKESITFEVVNQGGTYRIQEGYKDKVGAIDSELMFSGTEAVDAVVQTYLSQPAVN